MDSGRFLLAVILMIAVMIITNILLPPPRPQRAETSVDSTAGLPAGTVPAGPADSLVPVAPIAVPGPTPGIAVPADTIVARSALYEYRISTLGAGVIGGRMLQYPSHRGETKDQQVELASDSLPGLFGYRIRIGTREIALDSLLFTSADRGVIAVADGAPRVVRLSHRTSDNLDIEVAYTFVPDRYVVDTRIAVTGTGEQAPVLLITMPSTLAMHEARPQEDERFLAYVYRGEREGIGTQRLASVKAERVTNGPLDWVAVKNKYFVAGALIHPESTGQFGGLIATPLPQKYAARLVATLSPGTDRAFAFRLFMGPREPDRIAELGSHFDDVNPFGWRPFRPILRPLGHAIQWALEGMHDLFGIGYGWVLVLFGVIIRIALWPLNAKAMRSQMKNMEIQPKLKEIQTKYKNEPEKLQKEMLRLYKEEGFNPMGGCLPMLIPLPILITLFFVLQSTIAFRGVGFLWLPDLSQADPLYILPILLGLSMYLMQWLSSRSMTEQNPQMKFMMYAMPAFMTVIFLNFASGLNLYYTAMNFASIPQQIQITRERARFQAARKT